MAGNLFIAIGTHRSKAEEWIRELPGRFPQLAIQSIRPDQIAELPENCEDSCAVVTEPYVDIARLRADVLLASTRGWETYIEYFPAEPLFPLIRADMYSSNILGAPAIKEELRQLQPFEGYQAVLSSVA